MNKPRTHWNPGTALTKPPNRSSLLVRALLAYAVYEHGNEGGTASRVQLRLESRSCVLIDNGRGIGLHRAGYVSGLVEQLTNRQTDVALHGIGLALIAMASPLMTIESRRDRQLRTQEFSWGVARGGVSEQASKGASGTRITFEVADGEPDIDLGEVKVQVDHWRKAHPDMQIEVFFGGAQAL